MPVEEFIALNPGFSRPIIRADMTPRIVLPADRGERFHENRTKDDDKSLGAGQTDQPKKGDTREAIAAEKAGVIKPGRPVVLDRMPAVAERVIREIATGRGARVVSVAEEFGDERRAQLRIAGAAILDEEQRQRAQDLLRG